MPKVYVATTHDAVTPELVEKLLNGVKLRDEPTPLAALTCRALGTHQLEMILAEGKYHQVKRMLAAAGNHCVALCRTQIGGLTLEALGLAQGEWCYLSPPQLDLLRTPVHSSDAGG